MEYTREEDELHLSVLTLFKDGMSLTKIAKTTGLSRYAVTKVIDRDRKEFPDESLRREPQTEDA